MTARAYVDGDLEITNLCRDRVMCPPSAERSYWLATGVGDGFDYWLRDDEIMVEAARPLQYCMHIGSRTSRDLQGDPCENEALDDSDYCAEHDGLMDTEWAYAEYIDRIHGDFL